MAWIVGGGRKPVKVFKLSDDKKSVKVTGLSTGDGGNTVGVIDINDGPQSDDEINTFFIDTDKTQDQLEEESRLFRQRFGQKNDEINILDYVEDGTADGDSGRSNVDDDRKLQTKKFDDWNDVVRKLNAGIDGAQIVTHRVDERLKTRKHGGNVDRWEMESDEDSSEEEDYSEHALIEHEYRQSDNHTKQNRRFLQGDDEDLHFILSASNDIAHNSLNIFNNKSYVGSAYNNIDSEE
mgnify:CR=1 FL=1